jgi:hypothetical protein
MRGAGGTSGGIGQFFIGLVMMIAGGYLFLDAVKVTHGFGLHRAIYTIGSFNLTSGMVLVPLLFGVGFIFYNSRNPLGWILTAASLIMLTFGIIASIKFRLRHMSAFELITILVLAVGGLGLFFSSLRNFSREDAS